MTLIRPSVVRAIAAARPTAGAAIAPRVAAFSTTQRAQGGGIQYDPPTGWLFGVKPGEKYQNEGWEGPFFYGFCGSLVLFTIAYAFKPDTS